MHFTELCLKLKDRLSKPLPGAPAHDLFRATPIGDVTPRFDHREHARVGAVMILLYEHEGLIRFPLIKRPEYPGAHGGQISLPGGKAEPQEHVIDTALRECEEEIGVRPASPDVLGPLTNFLVIPSNVVVTPVIAFMPARPRFNPDPYEVSRIIEASLTDLGTDDIRQKEILAAGKYRMMAPHFEVQNEVVWGATAMILNEFRVVIEEVRRG